MCQYDDFEEELRLPTSRLGLSWVSPLPNHFTPPKSLMEKAEPNLIL